MWRGSELVEYRIRSEHFRLAGSMFVSSLPRGSGGRVSMGALSVWRVCCAGRALAICQWCLARPCGQRAFFSSVIMASTRAPLPVARGRRTAAAVCTSAFWTFWSSCTAVMHGPHSDGGSARGRVGWRRSGEDCEGRRGAHWSWRGRASSDATQAATRLHRCACEGIGWGYPGGKGARALRARRKVL